VSDINIISIKKGQSLFAFISTYCKGEESGLSLNRAFHRLCSLMRKMNANTVVVEKIDKAFPEVAKEYKALSEYYENEVDFQAHRFTFILDDINSDERDKIKTLENNKFLASAIVISFNKIKNPIKDDEETGWYSYLYSAYVTTPKINGTIPLLNNYLHVFRTFKREVSYIEGEPTREYLITGTFFSEQNAVTNVCAHASLCMILNNMDRNDDILTSEDINDIVGIKHKNKTINDRLARKGLDQDDINKVLTTKKLRYKLLNFFSDPNIDYDAQIYHYLESKYPCLLVFTTKGPGSHIVPILGHTLNSDIWKPEAVRAYSHDSTFDGYFSAVKWVDHFVIHDDNFGMYHCLPVDTLKRITLPKHDPYFRAAYAVAVVPSDVTTTAREAEWASIYVTSDLLNRSQQNGEELDIWCERLLSYKNIPTIRTFNLTKEEYSRSLDAQDFDGNSFSPQDKQTLTDDLPDRFWLSEITLPDLYAANKHKIIDFFYRSNNPDDVTDPNDKKMKQRWLQVRFPYVLMKRNADEKISSHSLAVKSHYPLYPHNTDVDKQEW
jgi:uncharacterized protein YozE (UPF0346 family)